MRSLGSPSDLGRSAPRPDLLGPGSAIYSRGRGTPGHFDLASRPRFMTLTTKWTELGQLHGSQADAAWQWFIGRYRDFVSAAMRRLVWGNGRASAAAEEFWGYLFQSGAVARVRPQRSFRAYLSGVLRNYAHDWQRRNPRVAETGGNDAPAIATWPEDEESALWARHLLHVSLRRVALAQPRHARALHAFYGIAARPDEPAPQPMGATALAAELGCDDNALHQLLLRARRSLRRHLEDEIRHTVTNRGELDDELQMVLAALKRTAPGVVPAEGT